MVDRLHIWRSLKYYDVGEDLALRLRNFILIHIHFNLDFPFLKNLFVSLGQDYYSFVQASSACSFFYFLAVSASLSAKQNSYKVSLTNSARLPRIGSRSNPWVWSALARNPSANCPVEYFRRTRIGLGTHGAYESHYRTGLVQN